MSEAFRPASGVTKNIDVAATTANVKVAEVFTTQIRIMNDGSATAWVNFGDSSVTAALASGMPVGAGACEVVTVLSADGSPIYAAAIAAGSTGKIYFTPGTGL